MYILSLKFFYFKGGTLMKSKLSLLETAGNIMEKGDKNMSYAYKFIEERVVDNKDCKHDLR